MVFFYLVTTGWIFDISLVIIQIHNVLHIELIFCSYGQHLCLNNEPYFPMAISRSLEFYSIYICCTSKLMVFFFGFVLVSLHGD